MKSTLTDEELIRVYRLNQPIYCFDILYRRYYHTIYKQCLKLTRNAEQAQDFSQDIFIKVFHKLGTFQERSRFSSWLYSIAHNYCNDQIRRAKQLPLQVMNEYTDMTAIDKMETLTQEDVLRRFTYAFEHISPADQHLLRLRYEHEMSLKEMATQYGLSLSAVKMRLKRIRARMQRCYSQQRAS